MTQQPQAITYLQTIPRYSLYVLLIFTPLARGSVQGWAVTTIHLVTLMALTAFLIEKTLTGKWQWIKTPLDLPILCLLVLCVLSTAYSLLFRISFWSMILLLNYLTIFYLTIHTVQTRSQTRQLVYLIIGIALFLSVFGLFKRFGVNPFPWWDYTDLNYSPEWLSSTYGNHNHLAGYLAMAIPLTLGLLLLGYRGGKLFLMIYFSFLLLTALVLTLSRGGWASSLVSLAFMCFALLTSQYFERKGFLAVLIVGFLSVAFIVLASTPVVERVRTMMEKAEDAGMQSRITAWGGVVNMITDHPLLGAGPGTFAFVNTQYQPPGLLPRFKEAHNDYLHFISEAGLLLIPIIIWMIIALYKKGFQKLKNPSRLVRGITLGALAGITAILVHSIADFNLHIPANAILFTILAALIVAPIPTNQLGAP
jgi:O-antigen ligase